MFRTIFRGVCILATALLVASLPAVARAASVPDGFTRAFPELVHGTSVAVAPDGTPWFGTSVYKGTVAIADLRAEKLTLKRLPGNLGQGETTALHFDENGALWFALNQLGSEAIMRWDGSSSSREYMLPDGPPVKALTFGPGGSVWFVRGGGKRSAAIVGRLSATGAVTQFRLARGSQPTSIVVGPDGALWFNESLAEKIGRISTGGEIRLFELPRGVRPGPIVSGSDGTLWFGENGQARPYGKTSNRIGRMTVDGQVSELPIPFGKATTQLVADPSGVIWFATDEGDFSSISPSGNVGPRGCIDCGEPVEALALAPDGTLWSAEGRYPCKLCGGGSDLIIDNEGTLVGKVPAGALTPADPDGPPAEDPYANTTEPPLPVVRTGRSWGVDGTSAVVTGFIDSLGYPTTWRFRWGRTRSYGHRSFLPEDPFEAEEGSAGLEESIDGLCPATTYHYELVAYGSGGRAFGGDRTFRTKREKHPPKRCR